MQDPLLLVVSFGAVAGTAIVISFRLWRAHKELNRYSSIREPEDYLALLHEKAEQHLVETAAIEQRLEALTQEFVDKKCQIIELDERVDLQEHGLYRSTYSHLTSHEIKDKLVHNQRLQEIAVKTGEAAGCSTVWTVDGSRTQGRRLVGEQIKLMLRAFNGECDAAIARVKYNNANNMLKRIDQAFAKINKLGAPQQCFITRTYYELKNEELRLSHEYEEQRQAEREEQRFLRGQMREEEKATRELERAKVDAEREEKRWERALAHARAELASVAENERHELLEKIERLKQKLLAATARRIAAVSRASMTRTGHVYIISNVGSFGEDVFKIGLTRRLDPHERIRELGGASVPFAFDVHAVVYSDDAPALERALHEALAARQINKVNPRKEFFKVSLTEIEQLVSSQHQSAEVRWTRLAEARQYRESLAVMREHSQSETAAVIVLDAGLPASNGMSPLAVM